MTKIILVAAIVLFVSPFILWMARQQPNIGIMLLLISGGLTLMTVAKIV